MLEIKTGIEYEIAGDVCGRDGIIIRYFGGLSRQMHRALLRFSEYTTKESFRRYFTIEEYAQLQGIPESKMYNLAGAIMVLDYYILDMVAEFGRERLYEEESALLDYLVTEGYLNVDLTLKKKFFVISIDRSCFSTITEHKTLAHEYSHICWRSDENYRKKVHELFTKLSEDEHNQVVENLSRIYHPEEYENEFAAHCFGGQFDFPLCKELKYQLQDYLPAGFQSMTMDTVCLRLEQDENGETAMAAYPTEIKNSGDSHE